LAKKLIAYTYKYGDKVKGLGLNMKIPLHLRNTTHFLMILLSREAAIATGYRLDDRGVGVRVPVWAKIVSSPHFPDRLWGPPNIVSNGYQGYIPGVKRPGREAHHSPPASAEVKKIWTYTSTPPYAFMV
jgi:hypothetical protein